MYDEPLETILDEDLISSSEEEYTKKEPLVTQKVTKEEEGMRLDKFLVRSFPYYSRNQFIRLIENGSVEDVETHEVFSKANQKVHVGSSYMIIPPDAVPASPQAENIPLDILYEDEDLLVVNKPAGMVVHQGAGNFQGTLVNALLYHCGSSLSGIGGVKRPGIVHRIDKETSGILVVAKNDFTHTHLSEQFAEHTIERIYQAFVWGYVKQISGIVSGNIGRSPTNRQKMAIVSHGGKSAVTHYERLAVFGHGLASHIQCVLETGRTHQIRVHMASIGHSLIGDKVYGIVPKSAPELIQFFPRQALHAGFLGFVHPRLNQYMSFEAPLPEDMQNLLIQLQSLDK